MITSIAIMEPPVTPSEEDFNQPCPERREILMTLHEALGEVPKHFWAACYVCDMEELRWYVDTARRRPSVVRVVATQAASMVGQCKRESPSTARYDAAVKLSFRLTVRKGVM